jgi:hypothetical protein
LAQFFSQLADAQGYDRQSFAQRGSSDLKRVSDIPKGDATSLLRGVLLKELVEVPHVCPKPLFVPGRDHYQARIRAQGLRLSRYALIFFDDKMSVGSARAESADRGPPWVCSRGSVLGPNDRFPVPKLALKDERRFVEMDIAVYALAMNGWNQLLVPHLQQNFGQTGDSGG